MFRRAGAILILVLSAVVSPNILAVPQDASVQATAESTIRVDEGASRIYVNRKPAKVELVVVSGAAESVPARLAIEVLDPRDVVRASAETSVAIMEKSSGFGPPGCEAAANSCTKIARLYGS